MLEYLALPTISGPHQAGGPCSIWFVKGRNKGNYTFSATGQVKHTHHYLPPTPTLPLINIYHYIIGLTGLCQRWLFVLDYYGRLWECKDRQDKYTFVQETERLIVSDLSVQMSTGAVIAELSDGRRIALPNLT